MSSQYSILCSRVFGLGLMLVINRLLFLGNGEVDIGNVEIRCTSWSEVSSVKIKQELVANEFIRDAAGKYQWTECDPGIFPRGVAWITSRVDAALVDRESAEAWSESSAYPEKSDTQESSCRWISSNHRHWSGSYLTAMGGRVRERQLDTRRDCARPFK